MEQYNVCYMQNKETGSWEWWYADKFGNKVLSLQTKFVTFEDAKRDYELKTFFEEE